MKRVALSAFGLLLFLALWQAVPLFSPNAQSLLPLPSQIPLALVAEARSGMLLTSIEQSLGHYFYGLGIGIAAGVATGVLTGMYRGVEDVLAWIMRVLRPIPGLAWIPFAIIWFGVEQKAAVFIVAIGVFWIVFFATHAAIRNVDRDLIEVADTFGFRSGPEKLVKILFPASLPGILVGVRTALGQAWMAVVAAELFGVTGLGQRMNQAASLLATDVVVVYMLTIAALYGLVDTLFLILQARLLSWKA